MDFVHRGASSSETPRILQQKPESPKNANGKRYFQVSPQLPCTFFSCYLITTKKTQRISNPAMPPERSWLAEPCGFCLFWGLFFFLDSHTLLFEAACWQSVSIRIQNMSNCDLPVEDSLLSQQNWQRSKAHIQ